MSLFTTLCHSIEHRMTTKYLGGYERAAKVAGNINLLHRIQDSNICPDHFYSLEEEVRGSLTLNDILNNNSSGPEIDMTGTK